MRYVGIDPSTKTGIVILNRDGELLDAHEIVEKGTDPGRMIGIISRVTEELMPNDFVAIEGFGFASRTGFLLGGIGWGIRMELFMRNIKYVEVAPAALKKFAGAKGNDNKNVVMKEVYKRWGFEHRSDNVIDAYVLAQVARSLREKVKLIKPQQEVLDKIS